MKAGWQVKTLGSFSEIRYGYTASAKYTPVGPRFLRITDIQDGGVNWENVPFCEIDEKDRAKFGLAIGDIVFARTGATTGKSYLIEDETDAVFASYLIKVRADNMKVRSNFLLYYFNTSEYWDAISIGTEGAAQGGFNASKLAELPIPLPPLEEQRRIVGVLDAAFAGITRARALVQANLDATKSLRQSLLAQAFAGTLTTPDAPKTGWQVKTLGEVCGFVRGPFGGSLKKEIFVATGYAVYEQQHAIYNQFDDVRYFVDQAKFDEMKRFELKPNDLIMSCSGTMGKVAIVPNGVRKGIINQALLKLTATKNLDVRFLLLWMESPSFDDQLNSMTMGAAIKNVASVQNLKLISIPIPPLTEQRQIVEILDTAFAQISQTETHYRAKLADLDALRQSLLQKAFAGELV